MVTGKAMSGRALSDRALWIWSSPVRAGLAAMVVYVVLAVALAPNGLAQSPQPYFVLLADAFLHGQLALLRVPPFTPDLSFFQGHWYLYWPPFPALLFMPLVAVFGSGVTDAPLSLAVAGLDVVLVGLLLSALNDRCLVSISSDKRAWLTFFFAFGTVHLTLAPFARVWFTAQLIGFALVCAAYLAALRLDRRRAPIVCGLLVACAFLSRSSTILASFWIAWLLWRDRDRTDRWATVRMALAGLLPLVLAVALLGAYNYLRFASPLETGMRYQQVGEALQADFLRYGPLSLVYIPTNFYYQFVAIPYLAFLTDQWQTEFWMGGNLFLMSPVFLLAFLGVARTWRAHGWALALSFVAGMLPALLLLGTGFIQFGPRYSLDVTVPLLIATAVGAQLVPTRLVMWLTAIALAWYLPGTVLFGLVWAR